MTFFVEVPVSFRLDSAAGVRLDLCGCLQVISDEIPQVISVIGSITNHVAHAW